MPLPTPPSTPSFEHSGSAIATHFSDCRQFFAGGVSPTVPKAPMQRELCYEAFAILHSGETKTPVYVAQRLNRQSVQDADEKRTNMYFAEGRLPRNERAELSDYKGSSYARGHMAPAGDMPNPTAMAQSFSLANMVPQNQKQNEGAWAKIEQDTRRYVLRAKGDVFVITGPVFGTKGQTVGVNRVHVPTHLFKLIYDATTGRAWAHLQPNSENARTGRPISYGELRQRIGMELLPGVDPR
ncbi:DNA/RNA non-specific endonuclease [Ottowia caeni]|uniref:DNA/RNA non-specific endonuclease n=1 Tax=Ottowia caeni TaxID=2870339 RepID=UPI003D71249D